MSESKNLEEAFEKSENTRTAELTLMGNRNTMVQILTLLSYIRTAIQNNSPSKINVEIGNNILNGDFEFLVNNTRLEDIVLKNKIEIN